MKYIIGIIALLAGCWGCKEDPSATPPPLPTLTVSTQAVTFEASQTAPASVTVTTNQSQWTATCPTTDTWCHLLSQGKTLLVTVDPNKTTTTRSTLVTVTVGTGAQRLERTISVHQKMSEQPTDPDPEDPGSPENPEKPGAEITLNLSSESLTLPIAGGSEFITVTSSTSWSATLPAADNWCSLTMNLPVGFTLTAPENTSGADRSTTITVTATEGTTIVTKTVVVTQLKNGEITAAFTDPYFKAFVLRHYDKNLDNRIQLSEVETVTKMSIEFNIETDDTKLASLNGIEHFTKLKEFDAVCLNLSNIDLSRNTNLIAVSLMGMSLNSLNLSDQPHLISLSCISCKLTSLDVSKCPVLETLTCASNQLTTLDISSNLQLTSLNCYGNKLTTIDVTQNTLLRSLGCGQNQLSPSLDISQNTVLDVLSSQYNPNLTTIWVKPDFVATAFFYKDPTANYVVKN